MTQKRVWVGSRHSHKLHTKNKMVFNKFALICALISVIGGSYPCDVGRKCICIPTWKAVLCTGRMLVELPHLPSELSREYTYLDLSGNLLKGISVGRLSGYTLVNLKNNQLLDCSVLYPKNFLTDCAQAPIPTNYTSTVAATPEAVLKKDGLSVIARNPWYASWIVWLTGSISLLCVPCCIYLLWRCYDRKRRANNVPR